MADLADRVTVRMHLPDGVSSAHGKEISVFVDNYHGGCGVTEHAFSLTADENCRGKCEVLLEIKANGRPTTIYLPLVLLAR